jgi:DNA polymerase III delta prime subunit
MIDTKDYYKIACEEVDLVLLVKKLRLKEQKRKYGQIKTHVQSSDKPIGIEAYKKHILNSVLYKPDEFFQSLPKDSDERRIVINAVYESILDVYPHFDINIVCADVNRAAVIDGIKELMGDIGETGEPDMVQDLPEFDTPMSVKTMEKTLRSNIIGQEGAVDTLMKSVKLIASGLYNRASFFFIGPTGVGKTELARIVGKQYSGNFWKINCAEYATAHEYAKLIGSPPGYIGHSEKSIMYEKAEQSNKWVILFDEIEKAHHKFYDFLLSLLDDGTCTDNMGRVLDFSNSIFIFTSNQGVSDLKLGRSLGFGNETVSVSACSDQILQSVKKKFPAEFLNRLDNYVFFNSLSRDDVAKITKLALNDIPITKTKALVDYIVDNGYSEEYGARNIRRFIKNNVATKIADAILDGQGPVTKSGLYSGRIQKGELVIKAAQDHAAEG